MKKLKTLVLLLTCGISNGQNLVPNPSFEDTATVFCGIFLVADFNSSVNYWNSPTQGTPDLYSTAVNQSCWNYQPNSTYGGPIGLKGTQLPRTGEIFAGLGCYTISGFNQREYIQTQLVSPLISGNSYYVEFYVSLADNVERYTDKLGAYFSDTPITSNTDQPLAYIPQIAATSFISETSHWVKISGILHATSAFNYITIGNFNDDINTLTMANPGSSGAPGCYGAYYYIDDIIVSDVTGVFEMDDLVVATLCPNPFTNRMSITISNNSPCDIILYDLSSRKILQQTFTKSTTLNTEQLANGMYFYTVQNRSGIIKTGKVIK